MLLLSLTLTVAAGARQTKLVALTFDDGPSPEYTPQVLDILERKQVRATFFLIGKWLKGNDALVNREVQDGDQLANHTWDHVALPGLDDAAIRKSIADTSAALTQMTGLTDCFPVRPPMGKRNSRVLSDIAAPVILWSVDPAAGQQVWSTEMVRRTLAKTSDGGIILLHDTTQANVNAVEPIIDGLRARGYEFVTLRELFRLRGITPRNGVLYQRAVNKDPLSYPESKLKQHWAYSDIRTVETLGCMQGSKEGFLPNHYLTRGQAVTVLWRLCGSPTPKHTASFTDVPAASACGPAAAWAKENGIALGKDGKFTPNARVSREELYVLLCRTAELQGRAASRTDTPVSFPDDRRIDGWAADEVNTVRAMGFSSKNDVELFRPRDWATRAEAAELFAWYGTLPGGA